MFSLRNLKARPGSIIEEDPLRTIELATAFRRLHCYRCDMTAIYKYRVQQVRRSPAPVDGDGLELPEDQVRAWRDMPRFAEIPETVKCKRCGEVLGLHTDCIY